MSRATVVCHEINKKLMENFEALTFLLSTQIELPDPAPHKANGRHRVPHSHSGRGTQPPHQVLLPRVGRAPPAEAAGAHIPQGCLQIGQ